MTPAAKPRVSDETIANLAAGKWEQHEGRVIIKLALDLRDARNEIARLNGQTHYDASAEQAARWRECAQALAEALASRGEHEWSCARADFRGGRPRDDGGYEFNYHGVWYESRPEDHTPKCDCEIGPALARFDAAKKEAGDA